MNFDEFIDNAWNDHADHPQEVAERLAVALPMVAAAQHVAPFARIVTHVYGEHLGQWQSGITLLEALRRAPPYAETPEVGGVVKRGIATLRYTGGDVAAIMSLGPEERATVLAAAASALTAHAQFERALDVYAEAVALAGKLPKGSAAFRSLAAGGNNLSAALEERLDRDDYQTQGMVAAARGGVTFWRMAGTWLEEERAHYRLARSLLAAGQPAEAVESARQCAEVCLANDAPAFERFFAYAVLARALREAGRRDDYDDMKQEALAWFERVPDDDREWCEADLAELVY
jgi:hypothetical protein